MTRAPFLRLALLAAATALIAALIAAALLVSLWLLVAFPLGAVLAVVVTVELRPDEPEPIEDEREPEIGGSRVRQPEDGTRGFVRVP